MTRSSYSRRSRVAAGGFVVCLAATAATLAFSSGAADPTQPTAAAAPTPSATRLPASPPTQLSIARLGVRTPVVRLGAAEDRTLELPPLTKAGWDATSATPGEPGVTVVAGFIRRTEDQPGALRSLGRLRAGDVISLRRADRRKVDYEVTEIAYYPQGRFPAKKVFAATDRPELRLVSTGGALHPGDPLGNAVVYAEATD